MAPFDDSTRPLFRLLAFPITALMLLPAAAIAQQGGGVVTFGDASGAPGTTVNVEFSFENTEAADALEARARIQGIDAFASVDLSNLCESASAIAVSCTLNDTNRILVTAANSPGVPLASFSGTIAFTISASVSESVAVPLEWDAPEDQALTFTPSQANDGLVAVVTDGPQLALAPQSLEFASREVGQTSPPQLVEVSNSGGADGLSIGEVTLDSPDFVLAADGCSAATLGQGETCSLEIAFSPTVDGALAAALTVPSNIGSRSATISGTGTAAALDATPTQSTLDFGPVPVGDTEAVSGQFANTGTAPLDISCQLSDSGSDFALQPDPLEFADIAPGASRTFQLTFSPSDAQPQTAELNCESNALEQPQFEYVLTAPGLIIFTDRFGP